MFRFETEMLSIQKPSGIWTHKYIATMHGAWTECADGVRPQVQGVMIRKITEYGCRRTTLMRQNKNIYLVIPNEKYSNDEHP